ncbi:MAG: hypothetical protein IJX02_08145 [Clostridia bacterium]|nr:hypothetical protein [Clostridia bacterium]
MGEIISDIMSAFTETISGYTSGFSQAFTNLIYTSGADGERVLSDFAKFGFVFLGFGAAIGVIGLIVGIIRR